MKRAISSAAAVLAAAAIVAAGGAAGASAQTPAQAEQLGHEAYRYGFPLLDLLRIRREETSVPCPDGRGNAPVNHLANASKFATPDDRTVVAPNTDTLYTIAHLDLGKGPVVLRHPDMGDRFFDFELVDPYTNVIGYVGTRTTGSEHGRFAISWNGAPGERRANVPVIKSKFRRVWLIGRTLAGDEADQAQAFGLMRKYKLTRANGKSFGLPADCYRGKGEPSTYPTPTTGPAFVTSLNRALAKNPPPKRDGPILEQLAPYGVGPGLSPADATVPAEAIESLHSGIAAEAAALPQAARLDFVQKSIEAKGWITAAPNIGDFGTDYAYRALIAVVGIGANTPKEAIYPATLADSNGALLNGANDYRMVFPPGGMPPARYFWSLTMYDLAGYLVDNPIDRYSLGPTHPPLAKRPDGSIVVAVQQDPPTEADVNWLPSPPGSFRLNMRLYGPRKAALDWTWRPPPVIRQP